jgi:hypothetical protein
VGGKGNLPKGSEENVSFFTSPQAGGRKEEMT